MIALDGTTISLQVVLAGAVTTNEAQCYCVYYDVLSQTKSGTEEYKRAARVQNTNGATAVTAVASPANTNVTRMIEHICVYNYDTVSVTATVQVYNSTGTVTTRLKKTALNAGQSLVYEHGAGWLVL
jgi:hypothetical protein